MESLISNTKSLIISSLDKENNPKISYAPFVFINNKFYIYISKVAEHYNNMINNEKVSIMIIEDEKDSKTVFARTRVSFSGKAKKIEDNEEVFNEFSRKHEENMISMLRKLDFNLFEIEIEKGRYVEGFGKAFNVINDGNKIIINKEAIHTGHN